jgi:hypothetical protein
MFHDVPDKDNFMLVMKCQVCGKENASNFLVRWSPQTWKEKGPLPTSFTLCNEHTIADALQHNKDELQKALEVIRKFDYGPDFHC